MKSFLLTGLLTLISTSSFAQGVYAVPSNAQLDFSNSTGKQVVLATGQNNIARIVLYRNVITIGGQIVDCRVTVDNDITTFDSPNPISGVTIAEQNNMFIPIHSTTSERTYTFEFGEAQFSSTTTFDNTTFTRLQPLVLNNISLNFYDVDGITASGSVAASIEQIRVRTNNYTSYNRYSTTSVSSPCASCTDKENDFETIYFESDVTPNSISNYASLASDSRRARVLFGSLSSISIRLDANTAASTAFYLDFSFGRSSNNAMTSDLNENIGVVEVDLDKLSNTKSNKYNIVGASSSTLLSDGTNNTNITTANPSTDLIDRVIIRFRGLRDGANERLLLKDRSSNNSGLTNGIIALNSDVSPSNNTQFTINGTDFRWSVSGNSSVSFRKRTSSTVDMTPAEAESILDALEYNINTTTPQDGVRMFDIRIEMSNGIESPSAFFIADIGTILPVNLISFTGLAKTEGNQLNWTVAQEVDFSHYEVLRSTNGKDFAKVGEVFPENKSTEMKNYTFLDASVKADLAYYKLNLINEDGSSSFSNLVVINRTVVAPVITKLYPNPATTTLLVSLEGVDAELSTITIHDLSGKIVYTTETSDVATLLNINELNKGMYIVKVASQSGFVSVSRFIKN